MYTPRLLSCLAGKPFMHPRLPIRATCLAHLIRLDLITRMILSETYNSRRTVATVSIYCQRYVTSGYLYNNLPVLLYINTNEYERLTQQP
jgi:hypothetical protein